MLCRSRFQFTGPYFFALYPSHQVHDTYKYEEERSEESKQCYVFRSIKFLHGPSQPFRNNIHAWHHQQGEEEGEDQSENDGPAQRTPEHHAVTPKEDVRIKT